MARWNRAVGGVRSYAKRLRAPKAVRQAPVSAAPSMAPAQIEALKTFGFPVPAGCEPLVAPKPPRAALKPVTRVTDATARPGGVDVRFSDGHEYRFHNMWLRDACRDRAHVLSSQERRLDASPLVTRLEQANVARVTPSACGATMEVSWREGSVGASNFDASWLRAFADTVAKPLATPSAAAFDAGERAEGGPCADWFDFIRAPPRAKPRAELRLVRNDCPVTGAALAGEGPGVQRVDFRELHAGCLDAHEDLLAGALDPGAIVVTGVPSDGEEYAGEALAAFAQRFLGPLQKHPLRETPHWTISTEDSNKPTIQCGDDHDAIAADNAIGSDAMGGPQLANHTDQALHDEPGLLLGLHCASGVHTNSLVDGFAVAYALRERHPALFDALATTGLAAGRRADYFTSGPHSVETAHRVLQTDPASGDVVRVRFHESYRAPLAVPYEQFERYWEALATFHAMAHAPEFARRVTLRAGELLVLNNWRTLHGRAGLRGRARVLVGGTVAREAAYSKARELRRAQAGLAPGDDVGLPTRAFGELADHRGLAV